MHLCTNLYAGNRKIPATAARFSTPHGEGPPGKQSANGNRGASRNYAGDLPPGGDTDC